MSTSCRRPALQGDCRVCWIREMEPYLARRHDPLCRDSVCCPRLQRSSGKVKALIGGVGVRERSEGLRVCVCMWVGVLCTHTPVCMRVEWGIEWDKWCIIKLICVLECFIYHAYSITKLADSFVCLNSRQQRNFGEGMDCVGSSITMSYILSDCEGK